MKKTLTGSFEEKEKEMKASVEELHTHYSKAHDRLKNQFQTRMNGMTEVQESIDFLAPQMTSACTFANTACDLNQPSQLVASQNQIMDRLNALEHLQLPPQAATLMNNKQTVTFTTEHDSALVQIQVSLQLLWKANDPSAPMGENADPDHCTTH